MVIIGHAVGATIGNENWRRKKGHATTHGAEIGVMHVVSVCAGGEYVTRVCLVAEKQELSEKSDHREWAICLELM